MNPKKPIEVEHENVRAETRSEGALQLRRSWSPTRFASALPPVAIVPGYAMNSHIFNFHPRGLSLVEYLAQNGREVWSLNLRGQGGSSPRPPWIKSGLGSLALDDLPGALSTVLRETRCRARQVDLVGASLGGTLSFILASLRPDAPIRRLVAMGAPLRWTEVHPFLRAISTFPTLWSVLVFRGSRSFLGHVFPILLKLPDLISLYMNPELVDTTRISEMLPTVEDPDPLINREIATWINRRDLVIDGINISRAWAKVKIPLFCVVANGDGIVVPEAARSCFDLKERGERELLVVGDEGRRYAHADIFVGTGCQEDVFRPVAEWLGAD